MGFGGVRGPLPKEEGQRTGHKQPAFQTTELDASAAAVEAPALPGREGFSERTCAWYDTWAVSPQAAQFLATDWQRLHMLAPLVERYFAWAASEVPAEAREARHLMDAIRQNEAKLGATAQDRLALRWRLRQAEREAERAGRDAAAPAPRRSSRARKDPRLALVPKDGK